MDVTHLCRSIWHLPTNSARFLVHLYQHSFSLVTGPRRKYYSSCSRHTDLALEVHGLGKGLLLIGWRLMHCNPLSDGGVDYPPVREVWKNSWHAPGFVTAAAHAKSPAVHDGKLSRVLPCC